MPTNTINTYQTNNLTIQLAPITLDVDHITLIDPLPAVPTAGDVDLVDQAYILQR
jgi:hypothetical protein